MTRLRVQRRPGWWGRGLAFLLLLLIADYALYPHLSRVDGRAFNHAENGLWLRYWYYFGRRSDSDLLRMAERLKEEQICYAYFHVRDMTPQGRLRYHHPDAARRLVAT